MVAGDVGQEGGEVKSRAPAHRRQDGGGRVGRHGEGVVRHADRGAQVALVRRDAGVEGGRDESGWFGWRDDERLGARPAL